MRDRIEAHRFPTTQMARFGRGVATLDRSFDIAFWQSLSSTDRFAATVLLAFEDLDRRGQSSMSGDWIQLLRHLAEENVRYLVVGGYAYAEYAEPRYTKDLDLLIAVQPENANRVFRALARFGAPLAGLRADDFMEHDAFYQMGRPPLRIDILTHIPGVEFETAWERRHLGTLFGESVPFLSLEDLIRAKEASGRPHDLADAEALRRVRPDPTTES